MPAKKIQIAVVEGNDFFNNLITRFLIDLEGKLDVTRYFPVTMCVDSFRDADAFRQQIDQTYDIVMYDSSLSNEEEMDHIVRSVKRNSLDTRLVVLIAGDLLERSLDVITRGASACIYKDASVLERTGWYVQNVLNDKLNREFF